MTKDELVNALNSATNDQEVVVRSGDAYFVVRAVGEMADCIMLDLGANFMPAEGGGTQPGSPEPQLSGGTTTLGTAEEEKTSS